MNKHFMPGITGRDLERGDTDIANPPDCHDIFPNDSDGSSLSLGPTYADTVARMPQGVINTHGGYNDPGVDPPVSEAQRRAMRAAAAGHSKIGIPRSVGREFSNADPGGKLPERKGKK